MGRKPNEGGLSRTFSASWTPKVPSPLRGRCPNLPGGLPPARSGGAEVYRHGVVVPRAEGPAVPGGPAVLEHQTGRGGQGVVLRRTEPAGPERVPGHQAPAGDEPARRVG